MASGHVNRTQRPNTWLHRPTLRREDSPCQLGAVHTWPETEVTRRPRFGRDRVKSRHNSDIAEVKRMTHICHSAINFAVMHNSVFA
jgi:hypothetical protein